MFKFQFNVDQNSDGHEERSPKPEAPELENPARWHTWDEFKPIRISYSIQNGIPRRDLFDVRYQLMQSDNLQAEEQILLGSEDVRRSVYEGGLKVWEGANDLLKVIEGAEIPSTVIELGCGAGIPCCSLILRAIEAAQPAKFVLADYNGAVLSLVTMPNIVLAWLQANHRLVGDGDVEITSELVQEMKDDLSQKGISVECVRGAWSSKFCQLVGMHNYELVLASETIYSSGTIGVFAEVVEGALSRSGRALVAAKKVYFGVGGSVVEFQRHLDLLNIQYQQLLTAGEVGRVVLEAKPKCASVK